MENIYILSFTGFNSATLIDGETSTNSAVNSVIKRDDLFYSYTPSSGNEISFEDVILFQTVINSANQDIISYSETCTLKIINCYKSCNECLR